MNLQQRDVLLGVLAVRLGISSAEQMTAARAATAADPRRSLADTLVERGAITPEQRQLIETMGGDISAANDDDLTAALAVVGGQAAVAQTFGGTVAVGTDGVITQREPRDLDEAETVTSEHAGRYSIGKRRDPQTVDPQADTAELGRGGIGRVLIAFDEHLGREVAMKELLPRTVAAASRAQDPRLSIQTTRFLREARVTGQLEHPNIIPVYELGRRADGALYYTMKIVRGRDLAAALADCRGLPDRLRLLKHFADLCDAMAYAHSRGVVHRDLKPDNVMVGEFGETVVLDWGLAKPAEGQDLRGADLAAAIAALKDSEAAKTADGTLLGTPLYMSPEQARGELHDVDARSDVYSLGAMLYQILTGEVPFTGPTTVDLLLNVLREPLTPVRERCPEAAVELAAVAEKALSRDRTGRYADARELAEEVRAYLTGGRVRAHDYRIGELIKRWAGRHKVALAVAAVGFALLIGLGVVSWLNIVAERNRAVDAERAAVTAQHQAEAAEAEAREARNGAEGLVRFMVGDLRDRLEPLGQIALLDAVVNEIDGYYRDQAGTVGVDDAARSRGKAATLALLADIQAARGELAAAARSARESLRLRVALAQGGADDPSLWRELGESERQVGAVLRLQGDLEQAKRSYQAALKTLRRAAAAAPEDAKTQLALSESLLSLGGARAARGDLPGASALMREAVDLRTAMVARDPGEARWRYELSLAQDRLGHTLLDAGDVDDADAAYRASLALREALTAERPENFGWWHDLASSWELVGDVALERGDKAATRNAYASSQKVMERVVAADPLNRKWQRDLAVSINRAGDIAQELGEPALALVAFERALAIMAGLAARDPDNSEWRRDLAVGHNRVGRAQLALGKRNAARASHDAALDVARALVAQDGDNATWRHDLAVTLMRLGSLEAEGRQTAAARLRYGEARALLLELTTRDTTNAAWRHDLEAAVAALDGLDTGATATDPPGGQRQRPSAERQRQRPAPAAMEIEAAPPLPPAPEPKVQRQRKPSAKPLKQRPSTKRGSNKKPDLSP